MDANHDQRRYYGNDAEENSARNSLIMKIHRFIGDFDLAQPKIISRDEELIRQIKNVLRLSIQEQVILAVAGGGEVLAVIEDLKKDEILFRILAPKENTAEPARFVTLYCSILKRENFELIAQKATECGVKKIVPIISSRTIKTGLKKDRLEKIIKEASEQSGRGIVPELGAIISLTEALVEAKANESNLFFAVGGEKLAKSNDAKKIGIFIGPEGGWTEEELALAKANDCQITSLGALTLRGETAAIVTSYLAVNT
jgi:16S rRNA (uracil1498-N3)-methyltransferase